jgi:hypothetical protein
VKPGYNVTTRVAGEVIGFREPVDDPFIRHTVYVGWRDLLRALRRRVLVVEVLVDADRDTVNAVMSLGQQLEDGPAARNGGRPEASRR